MLNLFNRLFPVWAIVVAVVAFVFNESIANLQFLIVPLLALVMFFMGLTLSLDDFARLVVTPKPIAIGVILQFLIMPLAALTLANILQLSTQLTVGMVLVGSCSGGTASNVICYLAKADVALSISMTMISTLAGVIATPLLCSFYLSETVDVDTVGMIMDIIQIVFLPVSAGVIANHFLNRIVSKTEVVLPSLSVVIILLIIGIIVALNADQLLQVGLITLFAVILHNLIGLSGGFYLSRLLGIDVKQSRTIAIEVGMQNSGLGVALALEYFSATAALPGALFSIWHNISGSLLASKWSTTDAEFQSIIESP